MISEESTISVEEAARVLNVSRAYVLGLLEKGEIPFEEVDGFQKILLTDFRRYELRFKAGRRKYLDFLVSEGQRLDMGYE